MTTTPPAEAGVHALLRRRWVVWGVLALVYVVSYFHRLAPAVLAKRLMAAFTADGAQIALLASLYLYAFAAMQPAAGGLSDVWGPRKTVTAGAFAMALGAALFAVSGKIFVAYFARFVVGVGASVVFIGTLKQVSSWFRAREFATLSGLTQLAGNAGGLLAQAPLTFVVARLDWRPTFLGVAASTAAIGLLCWAVVRDHPEEAGLPPLSSIEPSAGAGSGAARARMSEGFRAVWSNRRTWPMFFVFFGVYGTLMSFYGLWGVPYLRDAYGLSPAAAAAVISGVALGIMGGAPLVGLLSDRAGSRRTPYFLFALAYVGIWALIALPSAGPPRAWLATLCLLLGVTGTGYTLTWALAREVNAPRFSGIATATVNAGGFLGAAVMQNVLGRILDARWKGAIEAGARRYPVEAYRAAFLVCLGVAAAACALTLLVTETRGKILSTDPSTSA